MAQLRSHDEIKELLTKIEKLARKFKQKLNEGSGFIDIANELAAANITLVFSVGEIYALEQSGLVMNKAVSKPFIRDNYGRFARRVL